MAQEQNNDLTNEEKRKAAYALNLCMISVSQIIDYNDIYILEQEYDSILNNLNLEEMPKDEALLDILKQLLNVITFFRIQEGDKFFVEREYQQRMKDAIWSAVPNLGVIVAGGDLKGAAISLITQVGIGYMNYRRERAAIQRNQEKVHWQLQRAAMEQVNGLRRELFDAAWRLADKYHFPDTYRITERQITRYNNILMDNEPLRRYERLSVISEKFEAYPPFLYFQGNAANMVYRSEKYDSETRRQFQTIACEHFKKFLDRTERNLLREDHILASGALEYFDILAPSAGSGGISADQAYLEGLLDRAICASGSAFDVLQLCAMSYLRIGNPEKAAGLLRQLVNEGYNTNVNAQLLSSLYVGRYIRQGDGQAKTDYQTLSTRVNPELLFPLPNKISDCQKETLERYLDVQKKLLAQKYDTIVNSLLEKYSIRFNRIIPAADARRDYPDDYFDDMSDNRVMNILGLFDNSTDREQYIQRLAEAHIESGFIRVLNEFYLAVCDLPCMKENVGAQVQFHSQVRKQIAAKRSKFDKLLTRLYQDGYEFEQINCQELLKLSLLTFIEKALDILCGQDGVIANSIAGAQDMSRLSYIESQLYNFCRKEGITVPEVESIAADPVLTVPEDFTPSLFSEQLLGSRATHIRLKQDKTDDMIGCILAHQESLFPEHKGFMYPFKLYIQGEKSLRDYIKAAKPLKELPHRIIAVLYDGSLNDQDLIFTTDGVYSYFRKTPLSKRLGTCTPYASVRLNSSADALIISAERFSDKQVNLRELDKLMRDLAGIERKYSEEGQKSKKSKEE